MRRILLVLSVAALMAAMMVASAMPAFAKTAQSGQNCVENIQKQNARGQTGSQTGSTNDEKQLGTAVTNCDQFYQFAGSNP